MTKLKGYNIRGEIMINRYEKKLKKSFEHFQLMDLIGFGTILGVKQQESYEMYVEKILEKFKSKPQAAQKQLFRLAKDVSEQNIEDGILKNNLPKINKILSVESNGDFNGT